MFQQFETRSDPGAGAERAARLREELRALGVEGFIVPRADEHQGEYVAAASERLAWLTGFTGSAGTAIVTADEAAIFVDGRYTLQVREQVDTAVFAPVSVLETTPSAWLKAHARGGSRIGYDPWLVTRAQAEDYRKAAEAAGATLVAVDENPLDRAWTDRPAPPRGRVSLHPQALSGETASDRLGRTMKALGDKGADAAVLTDPASIAWAFNIRGEDVPHAPLPLSFALLRRDERPRLFIDDAKLDGAAREALSALADIMAPETLPDALRALGQAGGKLLYDARTSAEAIATLVEGSGGTVVRGDDPVARLRARKSPAELAGTRAAHVRDGAAMARFLAWFDGQAPGGFDEIAVATALETFRREAGEADGEELRDLSFDSISSTGPNAAMNHYRVTTKTNRRVEDGDLFLIDSGGQYRDGTTDITRTILVGTPERRRLDLYRDRFTRVLKGHIAVARARFPAGTTGAQIDTLARSALWQAGLDFDHGTGHGVGVYLSVHEGPQRIAKTGHVALEPGMILSNEPGYYVAGDFGIRIENLVVVNETRVPPGGDRPMLSFETISFAPIDRRLVVPALLSPAETAWLDTYHARTRATLSGFLGLSPAERDWLEAACRPLA